MTENLSWKNHIINLSKKIAPVVGILSKFKNFVPKSILYKIYFSLIHSRLCYLVGIWGYDETIFCQHLQSLQNRALKHVNQLPYRFHTSDLYKDICPNILTINYLYKFQICKYIHNTINNSRHSTLRFVRQYQNHQYLTRNNENFILPNIKTMFGLNCLSYSGIKLYNALPSEIKSSQSFDIFCSKLKIELITNRSTNL